MERMQTWGLARIARWGMIPFCIVVLIGCGHLDMYDQVKYNPYEKSDGIFSQENGGDGAASRPLLPATFPRGQALSSEPVQSGRDENGNYIANPIPVDEGIVARGKDRYTIYCVPCHGDLANGRGIAAAYFATANHPVPSFYEDRLVNEEDGYFFDVITNGKEADQGGMYSYASRVKVEDRWAIIAYIRTLQAAPPPGAIPPPTPTPGAGTPTATVTSPTSVPAPTAAP